MFKFIIDKGRKIFIQFLITKIVNMDSIGIDIEEISRFREKKFFDERSFYEKVFTKDEIEYCLSKTDPYPHFAARFCAKEAAIKALKNQKIMLKEIEIKMNDVKPILSLPNNVVGLVSMSHTKSHAIAFVVIH